MKKLPVGAIVAIVVVAVIALGASLMKSAPSLGEQTAPKPDPSRFLPQNQNQGSTPPPTQ